MTENAGPEHAGPEHAGSTGDGPVLADRAAEVAWSRALWDVVSAEHAGHLGRERWAQDELRWGLFGIPESRLRALGDRQPLDLAGLDVLELGAGPAYVGAHLVRAGARVTALDLSGAQLAVAAAARTAHDVPLALLQADAEALPLAASSFDLVVTEHGVGAWCDPARWLPEAARVLRPGGRLVMLTTSPLVAWCVPADGGPAGTTLLRGPADVARVRWPGGGVEFHPSHAAWVSSFARHGFVVEALHELPGTHPIDAEGSHGYDDYYAIAEPAWAARWPVEDLWVARRR